MELEQIVVLLIAAYGAILSTIIYYQKWRDSLPKIVVDYYRDDPLEPELFIALVVKNFGKKSVTLSHAFIEEANYPRITDGFVESINWFDGTELKSGKNFKISFPIYCIPTKWKENEIEMVGIVVDQLGNEYRSKIIKMESSE